MLSATERDLQSQLDESSVVGSVKGSRTLNPGVVGSNPTRPSIALADLLLATQLT